MFGVLLGVNYMRLERVPVSEKADLMEKAREVIGCEWLEAVHVDSLPEGFVMLIDEEGKLKDAWFPNVLASYLYHTDRHGDWIAGNALIVKERETEEGIEFSWLDEDDANLIESYINRIWKRAVRKMIAYCDQQEQKGQLLRKS